jgi:hypothetical protein
MSLCLLCVADEDHVSPNLEETNAMDVDDEAVKTVDSGDSDVAVEENSEPAMDSDVTTKDSTSKKID